MYDSVERDFFFVLPAELVMGRCRSIRGFRWVGFNAVESDSAPKFSPQSD